MLLLPLVLDPPKIQKYRNTVKFKVVAGQSCDLSKTTGEKYKTNVKRIRSIRVTKFVENPKKHPEMLVSAYWVVSCISGWFFGFFLNLVAPIDLNLFPLVLYFSPVGFDRSHDYPATIMIMTVFLYFGISGSRTKGKSDI